jgi:hypothetical protein
MVIGALALPVFQNCSNVKFDSEPIHLALESASVAAYLTLEDTPISANLEDDRATLSAVTGTPSTFSLVKQPQHGQLSFSEADTAFTYTPDPDFYGDDSFEITELPDGAQTAITRTVEIRVQSVNDLPLIKTDFLSFDLNSTRNLVVLDVEDKETRDLITAFSADDSLATVDTQNGTLEKIDGKIYYTPNPTFRGVDHVDFWAIDQEKGAGKKNIAINIGNPFRDMRPALAIRGSACVTCHANVRSSYITDFGFGSPWFAGLDKPTGYNGGQLVFGSGHMYGDHGGSWATAKIVGPVLVPKTNAVQMGSAVQTLASFVRSQEMGKSTPATVTEKDTVFIGAPTVAQLEDRFKVASGVNLKFSANDAQSLPFAGIEWNAAGYFTNIGTVICDGDLFLRGTVLLKKPVIRTKNGCRIHATGPIFMDENSSYENLGGAMAANNTNLQLVSARAVILGVGTSHCEPASGWYPSVGATNPLKMRLVDIWTTRSHVTRSVPADPRAEAQLLLAEAGKLQGYRDASCYAGGRNVHLERILINAPMVQSRLTGNVSGVVITEVALFSLSAFSYEFDAVFSRVPVLPLLKQDDFLNVK